MLSPILLLNIVSYLGSLRHAVQNWLRGSNLCLLKAIDDFPTKFISSQHPLDFPATYNDEELDAWVSEVKRWIRVLFLAAKEEEEFNPIIKVQYMLSYWIFLLPSLGI